MMEEYLRALLRGAAPVNAIAGQRINWGSNPTGTPMPRAMISMVSDVGSHTLDGPAGLSTARVQIDCEGKTYGDAKLLSRAVRAVLDGYRGGPLLAVFLDNVREGREGGTNEADRPFRTSLDVIVHYTTTT